MAFKLDLHSHSILSRDGSITAIGYEKLLQARTVDGIAVTDHGQVDFGLVLSQKFPGAIIPGEEIRTTTNDILGLYLTKMVEQRQPLGKAIQDIHDQGGLVYAPHPAEAWRRGITYEELEQYKDQIDIIEVFNGRTWDKSFNERAYKFALDNNMTMASSSDAHIYWGVGTAYTEIAEAPTRETLIPLLRAGTLVRKRAPLFTFLAPVITKFKRKFLPVHAP